MGRIWGVPVCDPLGQQSTVKFHLVRGLEECGWASERPKFPERGSPMCLKQIHNQIWPWMWCDHYPHNFGTGGCTVSQHLPQNLPR